MRILMLGSLGPYPERFSAFTNDDHELWYVSTELLPAPEQIPGLRAETIWSLAPDPTDAVERIVELIETNKIDVVYSLLNVWDGSNSPTAMLLRRGCPVPVVRHYKEHYIAASEDERTCIEGSTGVIFLNPESRDYFASVYRLPERTACLDADLLPRRYLAGVIHPKLSAAADHRPHLLIAGTVTDDNGRYDYRNLIRELTARDAHVHLYGQFRRQRPTGQMQHAPEVEAAYHRIAAPGKLHIHRPIPPARFVEEWSAYDAGLLHIPTSGDPFRVLNIPNRYSAYVAAGVPVAVPAREMPAMERQVRELKVGVVYEDAADLIGQLPDSALAAHALSVRESVTFEAIYPALISFIRSCLKR